VQRVLLVAVYLCDIDSMDCDSAAQGEYDFLLEHGLMLVRRTLKNATLVFADSAARTYLTEPAAAVAGAAAKRIGAADVPDA
jgi:hypothetical protein